MVNVSTLWLLSVHFISFAVLLDISQVKGLVVVNPKQGSVSGVFQVSLPAGYAFNASEARDVCLKLGVVIAEKKQVERALKNGFETCRFGWVDEQIAVVPRISVNPTCGQGAVGLVPWRANPSKKFEVFCFNSTEFEAQMRVTTIQMHLTKQMTTAGVQPQPTEKTASKVDARSTSSSSSMTDPEDKEKPEMRSKTGSSIGAAPTALLIATIFTFVLAAVVAVWYYRTNRSCAGLWGQEQQKECIETEVFDDHSENEQKVAKESQKKEENCSQKEQENNVSVSVRSEKESGEAA